MTEFPSHLSICVIDIHQLFIINFVFSKKSNEVKTIVMNCLPVVCDRWRSVSIGAWLVYEGALTTYKVRSSHSGLCPQSLYLAALPVWREREPSSRSMQRTPAVTITINEENRSLYKCRKINTKWMFAFVESIKKTKHEHSTWNN